MFESTKWSYDESIQKNDKQEIIQAMVRPPLASEKEEYQLGIMKRFDFSSKVMRMSVIVKSFKDNSYRSYIKGSPEKIKELARQASLPKNYDAI